MTPAERTAWVISLDIGAFEKSLLFVLAHRADSTTGECWITVGRLAREAGMSERRVQEATRSLRTAGLMAINRSPGRRSNIYRLHMNGNPAQPAPLNPAQRAGSVICNHANGVNQPRKRRHPSPHIVHPEPDQEPGMNKDASSTPSVWDIGARMLGSRALLGKLIRDHGEEAVGRAIAATDLKRPGDSRSYLIGALRKSQPQEVLRVASDW